MTDCSLEATVAMLTSRMDSVTIANLIGVLIV